MRHINKHTSVEIVITESQGVICGSFVENRSGNFPFTGPRPPGLEVIHASSHIVCSFLIGSLANGSRQASAMCPRLRRQSKVASLLPFTCADDSYNHSRHRYDRAPQCC